MCITRFPCNSYSLLILKRFDNSLFTDSALWMHIERETERERERLKPQQVLNSLVYESHYCH